MSAPTDRRFAPGPWYAVAGAEVTVLLPPTERSRAAELWLLADAGADADALIDALVSGGISGLGELVLIATSGARVRLLVRGSADVRVHTASGEEVLGSVPEMVWTERILTGVTGLQVLLTADPATADLPLTSGVAGVAALSWGTPGPVEDNTTTPAGQHAHVLGDAEPHDPEAHDPEPHEPEPHEPEQPAYEPLEEPTPVAEEPSPFAEEPALGATPQPEPGPEAAPDPVPEAPPWSDRDGHTIVGDQPEAFMRPEIPGQEHAPDVLTRPVARLAFSTGDVIEVDRTVLIGRAPEARRFTSAEQPRLVTVDSPHQEISSTHLEIRPGAGADHGSAVVTDLGSTNGTVLVQPGLPPEDLQPGIAVCLVPGAILDLGDGVTISTTKP